MKIKRYFAENIRQAMQLVRDELGADAVIMSNRNVEGGVEIVAARDFDEQVIRANATTQGREVESDFFKQSKPERHSKSVDLPDFQAERKNLHVISSPRKKEEPVFSSSSAKRGIDQYTGYAEKVQLRGNPDAVKHSFTTEAAPKRAPSTPPSVMIKVPQKSAAKPQPQYSQQMPQRESMYREDYHREPPEPRYQQPIYREPQRETAPQRAAIMPEIRDTHTEVNNEAHELRQNFSTPTYTDEFDEFLNEATQETYVEPTYKLTQAESAAVAIAEMPKPVVVEEESVSEKLLLQVTKDLKSLRNTMDSKFSSINFANHSQNPNTTPVRS